MVDMNTCKKILKLLVNIPDSEPHKVLEREEIAQSLDLARSKIYQHIEYLSSKEEGGFVSVVSYKFNDRTFYYIKITKKGIDILNEPNEFKKNFNSKRVYLTINGDIIAADQRGANQVVAGKDIKNISMNDGSIRASSLTESEASKDFLAEQSKFENNSNNEK